MKFILIFTFFFFAKYFCYEDHESRIIEVNKMDSKVRMVFRKQQHIDEDICYGGCMLHINCRENCRRVTKDVNKQEMCIEECKAATQDICPCNKCKADPSQFILNVLDDIFGFEPGWTFNLDDPDPSKTCAVISPYLSMVYVADVIFEFLGLDLVKQEDIIITR